jgi:pyridoxine/pyridoxamine 5'-phosphate oxidase
MTMLSTFPDDGSLTEEQLPERVRAELARHDTLVLAAVAPDGQPEAASVFFAPVVEGGRLLLVTTLLQTSRKLAHLRTDPRAAVYIGPREPSRWIQAECIAEEARRDEEIARRTEQLVAGAPGARIFVERVPIVAIAFVVTRLKLTDLTGEEPPVLSIEMPDGSTL